MATLTVWKNAVRCDVEFQPPQSLDQILNQFGYLSEHPCGGRGICGKCKVQIAFSGHEIEEHLRCQTVLLGSAEVWLPQDRSPVYTERNCQEADPASVPLGAAVDIGTTTIAAKLMDLDTGNCLVECLADNPQRSVAADVMGRIHAALTGSGQMLQQQILDGMEHMLSDACARIGCRIDDIRHMTIAGNTTMLYLLLGKSPRSLATAPFRAEDLFGRDETVLNRNV